MEKNRQQVEMGSIEESSRHHKAKEWMHLIGLYSSHLASWLPPHMQRQKLLSVMPSNLPSSTKPNSKFMFHNCMVLLRIALRLHMTYMERVQAKSAIYTCTGVEMLVGYWSQ
ncbi:unnamed protein product [Sphenostylis stenocarpa]|uniref:Uncharacterized protein n=1 Tax=Sphenostylis stenocarpa TaxID=92480 RepID=A0AA86VKW1_9FABA|nr:unnamed protein product [Sphenostylis stenocarpa]